MESIGRTKLETLPFGASYGKRARNPHGTEAERLKPTRTSPLEGVARMEHGQLRPGASKVVNEVERGHGSDDALPSWRRGREIPRKTMPGATLPASGQEGALRLRSRPATSGRPADRQAPSPERNRASGRSARFLRQGRRDKQAPALRINPGGWAAQREACLPGAACCAPTETIQVRRRIVTFRLLAAASRSGLPRVLHSCAVGARWRIRAKHVCRA